VLEHTVAKPGGFEWGVVKPEGLKFEAEGRERGWGWASWGGGSEPPPPPARGSGGAL